MAVALGILVGLVVVAVGVDMVWTAPQAAADEHEVLRTSARFKPVRVWTTRVVGAALVAFGVAIVVSSIW